MRNFYAKSLLLFLSLLFLSATHLSLAQQPPPEQPPDNVEGKWTIYSKNVDNGKTATKYIELKQNGNELTGHFKGPNQSGGLEGTINVHHIVFRTKTRNVLTFRGRVDGDKMSGEYGIHGEHGEWQAVRSN
ncbi:MAG: hypothetical protein WAM58_18455 [Candidatus Acidiferrum sp.]